MKYAVPKVETTILEIGLSKTLYVPLSKKMEHGLSKGDKVIVELKGSNLVVTKQEERH